MVDEAVTLREAVHQVFVAKDTGRVYPSAALKVVETTAREGRSRERLSCSRLRFARSFPFDELEDMGRVFALTAIDLLIARNGRREVRGQRRQLPLALRPRQRGPQRWCSDASCGARGRIARFRTRLKPKIDNL